MSDSSAFRRQTDTRSEREAIIDDPSDKARLRDSAAPCYVLTLMLLVVAVAGGFAVSISIAAFDPEHSKSTLSLLAKPSRSKSADAPVASRSSAAFTVESATLDGDTFRVSAIKDAAGHALTWSEVIDALTAGTLGPHLNAALAGSPRFDQRVYSRSSSAAISQPGFSGMKLRLRSGSWRILRKQAS